ncbi:MAG: L-seryl-tRNA(Sec) selenium transferase, partial [Actinomycetota bacterium]
MPDARRRLPSLDALIRSAPGRRASARFGRPVIRQALRQVLDEARDGAARSRPPPEDTILMARAVGLAARMAFGLSPVINATGVVLHTGLGRAPLPEAAVRAVRKVAGGYADLEIDRETGARGRRTTRAEFLLTALTGAEDALVVNNNAAALLLALAGLARRKDVLVSRGELIEIGGEFRLPEIMAASGARLMEVGTTNRTRVEDYRAAISSKTGLILKVHPSNYRVVGFAQSPSVSSLAAVARKAEVPLLHDVGSGLLDRYREVPPEEPAATEALAEGADLVCFSGDKLLGGPQAGILLGRKDLIARLRRHPVARAVRVDKMTVAALEAVLRLYAEGHRDQVPAWRLLSERPAALRTRARALAGSLPAASVETGEAVAGGGSIPGYGIPSVVVRIPANRPTDLVARLRVGNPAVICRVEADSLMFDLRTVFPQ